MEDRSALHNLNPHGLTTLYPSHWRRISDGSVKIVFQNTARHFFPDGSLKQTSRVTFLTELGTGTGLGSGIKFMELKAIPNDLLGRVYACETNTNTLHLFGTSMLDAIPVLDVSVVNQYVKVPNAGILLIFPETYGDDLPNAICYIG